VRSYNDDDLRRLSFIRRAQELGFSLEDIRKLLELSSSDCERVEKLAAEKLTQVKARLRHLRKIESVLAKTVEQCARRKGNQPYPIIETLAQRGDHTKRKIKYVDAFKDHWTQRKRSRIRLQPVLQKARTEIPPLVAEVSLSFMASLCTPVHEEN
jgi:DNA-binding transcriptional MerR regulator